MRNSVAILLGLMLLAAGGGLGWWLYQNVEVYEQKNPEQFSAGARRDPYLAAQYFLQQSGYRVDRTSLQRQLAHLPARGTVILTTPSDTLNDHQVARLLRWLRSGGHLLVVAGRNTRMDPDPLLGPFGVQRRFSPNWPPGVDRNGAAGSKAKTKGKTAKRKPDDESATRRKLSEQLREFNRMLESGKFKEWQKARERNDLVALDLDGASAQVHFDPDLELELAALSDCGCKDRYPRPIYRAGADRRVHFAQFRVGAGRLSVVSDLDFLTSRRIGEHDHALALELLAGPPGRIGLIGDVDVPPLKVLVWRTAPEALLALLVLVALGIWSRARRFGPIRDTVTDARRSLAEHIRASARYLWQTGRADVLLAAARDDVHRQARRLFADYDRLQPAARVDLLQVQTGLPTEAITRALNLAPGRDHNAFREGVATLQTIHYQLAGHKP